MTRPVFLLALSFPAAFLAACAGQNPGINPTGGDGFTLEVQRVHATAAVESGLAQAQSYCAEHGRLFLMTGSQVGSSSYNMNFRCVAPGNVPAPPQVMASAPPPAPERRLRGRRGTPAPVMEDARSGPALGYAAPLQGLDATGAPVPWQAANANMPPSFGPLTATPLFAPSPGMALAASATNGRRLPPPDHSAMELLPRLGGNGAMPVVPLQAAGSVPLNSAPLNSAPLISGRMAAQPAALPLIQAQPFPTAAIPLSAPPPSFGQMVPSPSALPGASTSLPPIAGGSSRPLTLPGSTAPSGFSAGSTGFTQGFR